MSKNKENQQSKMQEQLAEKISGSFGSVLKERTEYFRKNPDKIPNEYEIPNLIRKYARNNSMLSGGASLIPGPWGMVAVIPELVVVTRNQITMIHEIGMAYGKGKIITKELLAGIFLSALGSGAGALLVLHGSKVLVKRASLRAFQKVIVLLAGKITQQALKSTISKWLPVVGAAAMAAWSAHLTHQIGKKATEIFSKDIVFEDEENIEEQETSEESEKSASASHLQNKSDPVLEEIKKLEQNNIETVEEHTLNILKIQSLIYLMKIDGSVASEEKEFIREIIKNAQLKPNEIDTIRAILTSNEKIKIDYSSFKEYPEDALDLLIDLITLAHRDGEFHITEKMYIKQVGKLLDFSGSDIEDIIVSISS